MIVTCTMNPAIDLFCQFDSFEPDEVNRSYYEEYQANGKGVNVSFVLRKMQIANTATGFLGGFTGDFIEETLQNKEIATDFISIDGITRINTFIRAHKKEFKAVNQGPMISEQSQHQLLEKLAILGTKDMLIVSGSLPQGVPEKLLVEIAELSLRKGFKLVMDISSDIMLECLTYQPYLIKPNDEELATWLKTPALVSTAAIIGAANELRKKGARNVLVSRGEKGTLLVTAQGDIYQTTAPQGKVVNTACAGDTLLAAFIGSLEKGESIAEALIYATAAGSSTAFQPGISDLTDIEKLRQTIELKIGRN